MFHVQNSVPWAEDFVPEVVAHFYARDERRNGRSIAAGLTLNVQIVLLLYSELKRSRCETVH